MACRVRRETWVSCAMEQGWPEDSLATSARRVASPNAANRRYGGAADRRLVCLRDIVLDILHLLRPAAFVHAEGIGAAVGRNLVETGFGEGEKRSGSNGLKAELNQGGRFVGIVDRGVDRIGVPCEREQAFRLHFLDHGFPRHVFVAGMEDVAAGDLPRDEWGLNFDAKPFAELPVIGEGLPDARDGGLQFDLLFDFFTHG